MKIVLQRVNKASVEIDNQLYSEIKKGYLLLVCIEKNDTEVEVEKWANKITKLRIYPDETGKMNLSIKDISGEILAVSQFTLAADCKKGTRPSFDKSAPPDEAKRLYEYFVQYLSNEGFNVKTGIFGAMMNVSLINDGPVTLILGN